MNDIVILCERVHPETTQYDMILNLVSNSGFIDKGGHIYTELGVSSVSDQIMLTELKPFTNIYIKTVIGQLFFKGAFIVDGK